MCRIVGIVDFNHFHPFELEERITKMRDSLAHGGPDDAGTYVDSSLGVALGHRRLSILDLSSFGHQPMANEDGSIYVTFNGEVFNFVELRRQLENRGHQFRSTSDTEVLLKAYQEWGEESFKKFVGMFAFAILDKKTSQFYLVRDHAGIKPLYYHLSEDGLLFASEVRAFKAFDRGWEEKSDWRTYFLIFGHIPEPFTTLKNVRMLPRGSFMRLNLRSKSQKIEKYAQLNFSEEVRDPKEAAERVREEFTQAVRRHLVTDAPLGVFLSGGSDSGLIALVADSFKKNGLRTLSVVFKEKNFSEEKYQDIILSKIHSKHHSYLVTVEDFIKNLGDILNAMDQPTVDGINTYFISKCAKEDGLKSVLSGVGGDELFGGYPSFKKISLFWSLGNLDKKWRRPFRLFQLSQNSRVRKLAFLSLERPLSYYLLFRSVFSMRGVAQILNITEKEVCESLDKVSVPINGNLSRGNLMSFLETNLYMQNQLLKDTDFMSMWHSVEVRAPFLDRKFMELILSVDEKVKFNGGIPKCMLTEAFEDTLPREIMLRKKQGFTFPFADWIKVSGEELFENSLRGSGMNMEYVKGLWSQFKNDRIHWSRVWAPIILGLKQTHR